MSNIVANLSAPRLDLIFDQADDISIDLILFQDAAQLIPLPLDGYTFKASIKKSATDALALASFVCTVKDSDNGVVNLALSHADSLAIKMYNKNVNYERLPSIFTWDLFSVVSEKQMMEMWGNITINPATTTT